MGGFWVFGASGRIIIVKVQKRTERVENEPVASLGLDGDGTNYERPALRAVSAHREGALAVIRGSMRKSLISRVTLRNSLICRIGLTQVVDFHDISRYFSWFWRPFAVVLRFLKVQKQLMQVVDFHDSFR